MILIDLNGIIGHHGIKQMVRNYLYFLEDKKVGNVRVAIINCPRELGLHWRLINSFCAKWIPYHIEDEGGLKEGKHTGVIFFDEKNPELVKKIINLIQDESRKNMGKDGEDPR